MVDVHNLRKWWHLKKGHTIIKARCKNGHQHYACSCKASWKRSA